MCDLFQAVHSVTQLIEMVADEDKKQRVRLNIKLLLNRFIVKLFKMQSLLISVIFSTPKLHFMCSTGVQFKTKTIVSTYRQIVHRFSLEPAERARNSESLQVLNYAQLT